MEQEFWHKSNKPIHEYAIPYLHQIQVKNDLQTGIMNSSLSGVGLGSLGYNFSSSQEGEVLISL